MAHKDARRVRPGYLTGIVTGDGSAAAGQAEEREKKESLLHALALKEAAPAEQPPPYRAEAIFCALWQDCIPSRPGLSRRAIALVQPLSLFTALLRAIGRFSQPVNIWTSR